MVRKIRYVTLLPVYIIVLAIFILLAIGGSGAVTVMTANAPIENRKTVILDAGHGGVDGGAISCTGVSESMLNLEIALKLNDLMHLLGINTVMIRETDCSVYTKGETIAQKKISDLKERVRIVNSTPNAVLISIHQNYFSESQYRGAQVFYAATDGSEEFAKQLQTAFVNTLNIGSNRLSKKANNIYLLQKIQCTGILVECGFISNPQDDALLQNDKYQKKICCVIAGICSNYLHANDY